MLMLVVEVQIVEISRHFLRAFENSLLKAGDKRERERERERGGWRKCICALSLREIVFESRDNNTTRTSQPHREDAFTSFVRDSDNVFIAILP